MVFGLGTQELIIILIIILLLFGGKKLPELARALGRAVSEFKRGKEEYLEEVERARKKATKSK